MRRKVVDCLFLMLGIGMCLTPFLGMAVAKTDATLEKRALEKFPKLIEDEGVNTSFGLQLGDYFHDHFAWKNEFVTLDSLIQAKVFGVSAVDTVTTGKDGWLYYSDSLDDYLGRNTLTERGAKNLVHNLELMQQRVEETGAQFLFTVAPNKNSLYDANMPYYARVKASGENNMAKLAPLLKNGDLHYADLFQSFRSRDEILYRKQDSHWNEKGAALAYDTVMNALEKEHTDYSIVPYVRTRSKKGDLAVALYALAAKEEWDGEYEHDSCVSFTEEGMDWESAWIQTQGKKQQGNLLMYRDSFGNTLSPLLAEDYKHAAFSRENVYLLDQEMERTHPDTVLVEIVERNVARFCQFHPQDQAAEGPPLMQAPVIQGGHSNAIENLGNATVHVAASEVQPAYTMIYGTVEPSLLEADTEISVEVTVGDKTVEYAAFQTYDEADAEADNGYVVYLKQKDGFPEQAKISVLLKDADGYTVIVGQALY